MTTKSAQYKIRSMRLEDIPQVASVERSVFDIPWGEYDFADYLNKQYHVGIVAETSDGKIIGYIVYNVSEDTISVPNFAVDIPWRRQKIGTKLFEKLYSKLKKDKITKISVCVKENSLATQLFLKSVGYICDSIIKNLDIENDVIYHFSNELV